MNIKAAINLASAVFAALAAVLWLKSAGSKYGADGQVGPLSDRMIINKDGRLYNVTGTAEAQSRWSAYGAIAAAAAAALQAVAVLLPD
jgi:hypothetical protein